MNAAETAIELLSQVAGNGAARRPLPESTYRLQFHAGFTFEAAVEVVPYLHDLGITHCYASPYLKARPGSTHGYDIIDHASLNPEIGTAELYVAWVSALHEHGMGQIIDTVPNHMGVGSNDNPWWNDVLENGPASRFAPYFDIAWRSSLRPELRDKVLLPVLADLYGDVLEAGQFRLEFVEGAFFVKYGDRRFPIAPRSYGRILGPGLDALESQLPADDPNLVEFQSILTAVSHLPGSSETEPEKVTERQREKEVIKRRLATLASQSEPIRDDIDRNITLFAGTSGDAQSFALMDDLLENQCYRLSYWRVGSDEINYRRFFDVNDLAALAMERTDVFEAAHALIFRLVAEGKVDGLRIDHPDGLYDPLTYFRRLQEHHVLSMARKAWDAEPEWQAVAWNEVEEELRAQIASRVQTVPDGPAGPRLYVVIEKILGSRESLVETWPVHGTSGYDFMNFVGGLFVDAGRVGALSRIYHDFVQDSTRFADLVYAKKLLIMQVSLASELHMLTHQLDRLAQKSRRSRDFTFNTLRAALGEVIASFPVYRSYIDGSGSSPTDRRYVELAVRRARVRNPHMSDRVFRFIRDMLLGDSFESLDEVGRAEQQRFCGKFQQVTSPVMAKGLEDTAFYVYNRLISLNEVGGDPDRFGVRRELLHDYNQARLARWPYSLSPLSTHDTKRSEDVRARINVLSEISTEWGAAVERWSRLNAQQRGQLEEGPAPDANEEYLLYQTCSDDEHAALVPRVQAYMQKALREAKVHSSWINPDPDYDKAVHEFVAAILDENRSAKFLDDFRTFERRVSHLGLFNSLAQTLLKLALPGVPDTYQGTELWDFSLVDPDNRRPVDYPKRAVLLRQLREAIAGASGDMRDLCRDLIASKEDGRVKLFVHAVVLGLRRQSPGLLTHADYFPIACEGPLAEHVFTFIRQSAQETVVVAVPRLLASIIPDASQVPLGEAVWKETRLVIPTDVAWGSGRNVFTGEPVSATDHDGRQTLALASLFAHFPIALAVAPRAT
jgi:(1->4)-alpha-D-glucan 1-alpha-D-glucosylmutase